MWSHPQGWVYVFGSGEKACRVVQCWVVWGFGWSVAKRVHEACCVFMFFIHKMLGALGVWVCITRLALGLGGGTCWKLTGLWGVCVCDGLVCRAEQSRVAVLDLEIGERGRVVFARGGEGVIF